MKRWKMYLLSLFLLWQMLPAGSAAQALDSLSLMNVDSQQVAFKDYLSKKALVLVFTSNHCVYAKKYEDRLVKLAETYQEQDIGFCLVNSNNPSISYDDGYALMRARAKEKGYPCPYLSDADGALARLLGATKNPECFVFVPWEGRFKQIYSGKIDDNPLMASRVEEHYLRDVLEQVLAGNIAGRKPVPVTGCHIKFE